MAILYVYNDSTRSFEKHRDTLAPYVEYGSLPLRRFLSQSVTDVAWTHIRLLRSFDECCMELGQSIYVSGGFKRFDTCANGNMSARRAGLAIDMGNDLPSEKRERLRRICVKRFSYTEPEYAAPTWVRSQIAVAEPCGLSHGYPRLERDMCGVHVFVLQDALRVKGYYTILTGVFSADTERALKRFERDAGLAPDGAADRADWVALLR